MSNLKHIAFKNVVHRNWIIARASAPSATSAQFGVQQLFAIPSCVWRHSATREDNALLLKSGDLNLPGMTRETTTWSDPRDGSRFLHRSLSSSRSYKAKLALRSSTPPSSTCVRKHGCCHFLSAAPGARARASFQLEEAKHPGGATVGVVEKQACIESHAAVEHIAALTNNRRERRAHARTH